MTIAELKDYMSEHLVPAKLYLIGGESDGRICLEKLGDRWAVFFCEGKKKIGTIFFKDETSACMRMLREVSKVMELVYDTQLSPV
ncbi:MAG: hypothetical protein J6Q02_00540 [Lachnospiraceae bacterium]|nr:hypothetical protein [Lachnospiraceae bacterium]MBQ6094544.1 hypothetical protein [Lachnospiraceae bacterium]MBR3468426.1 hypothetical protein [Lachnospiraceae bacterium]